MSANKFLKLYLLNNENTGTTLNTKYQNIDIFDRNV